MDNSLAWSGYASEFNQLSIFSTDIIHLGLGIGGISANKLVNKDNKVLDVGCGNGINTYLLAKETSNEVVGIDLTYGQLFV